MVKIYRQGDVILRKIEDGIDREGLVKIAEELKVGGETGHLHTMDTPVFRNGEWGRQEIIILDTPKEMKHEEHAWLTIEAGAYEVGRVRDYLTSHSYLD